MPPSPSPRQGSISGPYLPTLDGWRAIAIGLVVCLHASDSMGDAWGPGMAHFLESILKTHGGGLLGVKIFFGISGFLITSRLLSEEHAEGSISLKSFYLRRAFRILPASFVFTSIVGLLGAAGILPVPIVCWASAVLCFANYLRGNHTWYLGHFWSLAVEEHFYLLWPSFLVVARRFRRLGFAIALALGIGLWRAVAFKYRITYTTSEEFWGRTDIQLDGLLWGSILALARTIPRLNSLLEAWTARLNWWLWPALLVACLWVSPWVNWKIAFALLFLAPVLIAVMVVGTTLHPTSMIGRALENPVLRWVGRISYSLYLWQQLFLVNREARIPALAAFQQWPLNLAAALTCAIASYFLVERPFIRIGHRLASEPAVRPGVVQQTS